MCPALSWVAPSWLPTPHYGMKVLVKLCSSAPSHQGRRLGCAPLCLLEFMGTKEKKGTSQAEHMQETRGWWRLRVWHELKGSSRGWRKRC